METNISNQLYNALSRLGRLMHRAEHFLGHRGMRGEGCPHRGRAHLLSIISRNNGASQRDLAEEADVRPSSMTEALLKLEAAGLITRKQDEQDQRVMRISLTEAGERAVRESDADAADLADRLFSALTPEERERMLSFVQKLNAALDESGRLGACDRHPHGFHQGHHGHRHHHCLSDHFPFFRRGNKE